jgi:site-specific DNA-methyltransferase (adenine-specific)
MENKFSSSRRSGEHYDPIYAIESIVPVTLSRTITLLPKLQKFIRKFRSKCASGIVVQDDALVFLTSLESESASLIFLDPPFNLGKKYSRSQPQLDQQPETEYLEYLRRILAESTRVLGKGGTLYLYHLPIWAMRLGTELEPNLRFQHWIAVSMKNGFVRGRRLYPAHYSLLMFTKGRPRKFRRPRIPLAECRHCGEYVKDYGGYLHIVERRGVNLSDFWDDFSPVRHAHRKNRAANELPAAFFQRMFEISGRRGGLYVDPFSGSGTGVVVAAKNGMRFAACDLIRSNCQLVCERLASSRRSRE